MTRCGVHFCPVFPRASLHREVGVSEFPTNHCFGWWSQAGSNRRPPHCERGALPAELWPQPWAHRGAQHRVGAIYGSGWGESRIGRCRGGLAACLAGIDPLVSPHSAKANAAMRSILYVILLVLDLYIWLLIAAAVLSWLVAFNVVNARNQFVAMVGDFLFRITRAGAAPDPEHDAEPRRHRYLAGDRDPDHHPDQGCDRPLHLPSCHLAAMPPPRPWTVAAGGLSVVVRLTPRGGRDAIDGIEQRADGQCVLKARVRAAASEGEANAALVALLAHSAGVPPRDVTLVVRRDGAHQAADDRGPRPNARRSAGEDRGRELEKPL